MHGATLGDRCHTAGATPADQTAAACPFRVRGKVHGRPRDGEVQHQFAHPAGSRPLGWWGQPLPAGEHGRPQGQECSRVTCCCSWNSELWDTELSEEDILWLSDFWLKADMLPGPPGPLQAFPAALRSGSDLGRCCGLWQVVVPWGLCRGAPPCFSGSCLCVSPLPWPRPRPVTTLLVQRVHFSRVRARRTSREYQTRGNLVTK